MNTFPLASPVKIKRARHYFFTNGMVPDGLVPEFIVRSWRRSASNGVSTEGDSAEVPLLSIQELGCVKEKNRRLLANSLPVMENLYAQIARTSCRVLLADSSGVVLHAFGDSATLGRTRRKISLLPGGVWSEFTKGTNAIGTALVEREPVVVHGAEHFIDSNHCLTCSAAPISDPFGRILGVLDVSGNGRIQQLHTMALVRMSVQQIENQLFAHGFDNDLVLSFHVHAELIGTSCEGIIVFSPEGRFLAANHTALNVLGLDRCQAESHSFSSLFNARLGDVFHQRGAFPPPSREMHTSTGVALFCRARTGLPAATMVSAGGGPGPRTAAPGPLLEDLELGDPAMRDIIARARKVLEHDIPVLLEGESGTGKEMFARAMHTSSSRRTGPFVALNCAALPEGLVESELFGYQEGAFTGAKRKGYSGKIRQAHGGTLFLDEIGDMPLRFQARLLRVLQERTVSPLGGAESYQVDFALICATNRRMREEVEAGRFREDLYYRLNGMLITLPCLRERGDCLELARSIISGLVPEGRNVSLSPRVAELFREHPWPGNIRQMHSVLRTAVALAGYGSEIALEHLSEDFLEQASVLERGPVAERRREATAVLVAEGTSLGSLERSLIRETLRECGGNITAVARKLGISRNTVYRRLQPPP